MAFELFQGAGARTKEYISVTENSTFGLPRPFLDKQHIGAEHKAVIFFDSETLKVAFHFTLSDTKVGLAVRVPNDTQGGMVVAKSFFEQKDIEPKTYAQRYHDFEVIPLREIGVDRDGNAYVIQLKAKEPAKLVEPTNQRIEEEFDGEEPLNLDDIPF